MRVLAKEEILEEVSDELFYWILDGTQDAIWKFEERIKKSDFLQVVHKFSDLMKEIKICTDLAFAFDSNADWLLNELVKFKKFLSKKEFNFSGFAILEELDVHIQKIKSNYSEKDFTTTEGDIAVAEKEMEEEKQQSEQRKNELVEKRRQDIKMKKENVERWRLENLNKDFDVSVLDEFQLKILKEALETELKCLSLSWLQRKFNMGYPKACVIVDFFEKQGIVSTYEEACDLAVEKYGRIIRVSLE